MSFEALLLGAYGFIMIYGICVLGQPFLHGETRQIPEWQFLIFGILLPAAMPVSFMEIQGAIARGWIEPHSLISMSVFLSLPVALLSLYLRGELAEADLIENLRRSRQKEHRDADLLLQKDPDNALTHWNKARIYEAQGEFAAALRCYERAHALSAKVMSPFELEDHRKRLSGLEQKRWEDDARKGRFLYFLRDAALEAVFFGFGCLLFVWSWMLALQVCSFMLFVGWFRLKKPYY